MKKFKIGFHVLYVNFTLNLVLRTGEERLSLRETKRRMGKSYVFRSFIICTLNQRLEEDKIKGMKWVEHVVHKEVSRNS
jgi:hypothetical protein